MHDRPLSSAALCVWTRPPLRLRIILPRTHDRQLAFPLDRTGWGTRQDLFSNETLDGNRRRSRPLRGRRPRAALVVPLVSPPCPPDTLTGAPSRATGGHVAAARRGSQVTSDETCVSACVSPTRGHAAGTHRPLGSFETDLRDEAAPSISPPALARWIAPPAAPGPERPPSPLAPLMHPTFSVWVTRMPLPRW